VIISAGKRPDEPRPVAVNIAELPDRLQLSPKMNTDCYIKIARENGDRKGSGGKLALYIRGRQVKATPAQIALLACLNEHQGRIVPYERRQGATVPHALFCRSFARPTAWFLRRRACNRLGGAWVRSHNPLGPHYAPMSQRRKAPCQPIRGAVTVAKAQAVLSESELLRAMFDVGYFPPSTLPDQ